MKYPVVFTTKALLCICLFFTMQMTYGGGGISGTGRGFGVITEFASIFVNGVEYDISTASIIINGNPATQADLKLGMAVRVEGTVNAGGTTGTATLVEFLGDIEGTVDAAPVIVGKNSTFTIYGLVIKTDRNTVFHPGVTLATLAAGDAIEVSGLFNANDGSFAASRIEKRAMFIKADLRGVVSNLSTMAKTFVLGPSLVVNYSTATLRDPNTGPVNGMFVNVKATTQPVNNVLTATRVSGEGSVLQATDMQLGIVQGVAANVTAAGFVMGNQPIVTNAMTVFDGAPASALVPGAKAIASGPVVAGVLQAAAITITPALTSVLSAKTHGTAGPFSLTLPVVADINAAIPVEPRAMGINHTLRFQFNGPIQSVGGVTSKAADGVTDVGTATFAIPPMPGNEVVVTLTGVADNSRATISLTNINQSGTDTVASIGFMIGDVTNTRAITAADISRVKARVSQPIDGNNFMLDVNLSGAVDAGDLSIVKSRAGTVLAP